MYEVQNTLNILEYILSSPRRRHVVGGILLSVSGLFAGLAITTMTLKTEDDDEKE